MKKIIYVSTFFLMLSCNKKEENSKIVATKTESSKALEATITKKHLDTVAKENSKEEIETILSLEEKIVGKWELIEYDLSEENDGDQEKPSGVFWFFKNDHICEERSDPDNPSNVTVYEYAISQEGCEKKEQSNTFFYVRLKNKTVIGDDYCFMVDIDKMDEENQDILRLYTYGSVVPDVLKRR